MTTLISLQMSAISFCFSLIQPASLQEEEVSECVRQSYEATKTWHAQQKMPQQNVYGDKPGTLRHPVRHMLLCQPSADVP